ncbi:MAG TPA: ribose-phosphate diphosphokinase [Phenylobacterium sp.]|jgi:ribose-phosphate pyrophosphokinase
MSCAVYAFGDDHAPAARLADALGAPCRPIGLHIMPDGESLPTVPGGAATALLYRALNRPDGKLMPLLLAADALRRADARRLVLVAPYMPYLRQDAVFRPGQPLSRDVIGGLLGSAFDRVVTVEPHLHRTGDLTAAFKGTPVTVLSAASLLAQHIGKSLSPVIVGPDAESEPWVRRIAEDLEAPWLVGHKVRRGDRKVEIAFESAARVLGRRAVIVDDICSSGATLVAATRGLRAAGAGTIEVVVVHALSREGLGATLRRAGADPLRSTDSCAHSSNAISLAPLLADALSSETDR